MQGHLYNINIDQGNLDFVDFFVERSNDITVNNIGNENVCNKSGMFINTCAEIISDTSPIFAECVNGIVNAVLITLITIMFVRGTEENLKELHSNPKVWKAMSI